MPTVLALSALVQAITGSQDTVSGTITVTLDGETAHEWTLTPEDIDVVRFLDLSDKATTGTHELKVSMQGQGNPGLQVVVRHYLPEAKSKPLPPAFDLSVTYDKTALTTADLVTATATATSRFPVGANMLVLDLAVPPGFDVLTEDLDALVSSEKIERYTMAARQIIVYLDKLDAGASLELRYRLKARVSLKAQSGESRVYAYYEPEKKGRAKPTLLEVAE